MPHSHPQMTVIPSEDRQRWKDYMVDSRQSFPATGNFDLGENAFGLLLVHNDDVVSPGEGFDMHQHQDMEIVSWIMEGATKHRDSAGNSLTVQAGQAQAFSAGTGIAHSEVNAGGYTSGSRLRVVQMWLQPDENGAAPRHAEADFSQQIAESQRTGSFFTVASGAQPPSEGVLPIGTAAAELVVAYPPAGAQTNLPEARYVHLYVADGAATVTGHAGTAELHAGDVLRVENPDLGTELAAPSPQLHVRATADAVLIAWRMGRSAR